MPVKDEEYVCSVWFERDRKNVSLETPKGEEIFCLWDEEVDQAIEDGSLEVPRLARMSSSVCNDAKAWQPLAVSYARVVGLIE